MRRARLEVVLSGGINCRLHLEALAINLEERNVELGLRQRGPVASPTAAAACGCDGVVVVVAAVAQITQTCTIRGRS